MIVDMSLVLSVTVLILILATFVLDMRGKNYILLDSSIVSFVTFLMVINVNQSRYFDAVLYCSILTLTIMDIVRNVIKGRYEKF